MKSHLSRKHHHAPEREGQLCPICGKKCYYTADLEIHIGKKHALKICLEILSAFDKAKKLWNCLKLYNDFLRNIKNFNSKSEFKYR